MTKISILSKAIIFAISGLLFCHTSYATPNNESRYTQNSVLSSGNWYKIQIPTTGVYKLTYNDLKKLGLSDPKNVKIYGYGGAILDEDFTKPYTDDLPQVSIWMSNTKENFGKNDYILFYAQGNIKWSYNPSTSQFEQEQNPYSFNSYYFVTESAENPSLVKTIPSLPTSNATTYTYNDYYLHEQELVNIGKSGRTFYGENFNVQRSRNFDLPLTGATSDQAIIQYNFVSKAPLSSGQLNISLNGNQLKTKYTEVTNDYYTAGTEINDTILTQNLKDNNTLNLTYLRGSTSDINVHLDYILVNYTRILKPYGAVTLFRSKNTSQALEYKISKATSSLLVFDVTNNYDTKQVDATLAGTWLNFIADNTTIKEYALVDTSKDIPKPTIIGKINNQNLHASTPHDMIIIVQPALQQYAQELAQMHNEDSGLTTLIVNPQQIYNEFSSGTPDATAYRRFIKMLYDKAPTEEEKPKYLLLFGGGTYDNRFIGKTFTETDKNNMLLTYQSKFSLVETASYVTDDYFGFLDDNEGAKPESATQNISIGRLPVRTEQEAADIVQKIKNYVNNNDQGIWQNNITFIADDAVAGSNPVQLEKTHMSKSEELATFVNQNYPNFYVNKIYEDNFERISGNNNTATYPDATQALLNKLNEGTLFLNFVGHGSTRSWTHENLLTLDHIKAMDNQKLPLWITATCDFSRFDDDTPSGGEAALFNQQGGAIALFSTVRVVYMANNKVMNENIIQHIFETNDGKPARLGDIIRHAKSEENLKGDLNKLKFLLLGDPALRLSYPDKTYTVDITHVNELLPNEDPINIESLGNVIIKGNIVDQEGQTISDFNGTLESIIFDVEQTLKTRGNTANGTNENVAQEYTDYTNRLFSGKAEIRNGSFEINFVAPKDILNIEGNGKMNFLAYDVDKQRQAQGSFTAYTVRGDNPNAEPENNPPIINKLFLNTEDFQSGDIVANAPVFVAEVSDDTGINLSNDGSHNISLLLDNKEEYDLTPFFDNNDGGSKSGTIRYQLPFLSNGKHTLQFTIWDVWNNATKETIDFVVASGDIKTVDSFQIWGNPAREKAIFVFNSEYPGNDVKIKINIYSLNGQMVWNHEERSTANNLNHFIYEWDLTGHGGSRLNPGLYICKAYITVDNQKVIEKSKKLVIIN